MKKAITFTTNFIESKRKQTFYFLEQSQGLESILMT